MKTSPSRFRNLHLAEDPAALLFPAIIMVLVVASLSGVGMNGPLILGLLLVGVVFFGLPHGSLDPLVAQQLFAGNRGFTTARFAVVYTLLAMLCVAGWLAAPNVGLTLFLVISALHFGSDWQERGAVWGRVAYGTCIVSVPTLRHAEAVRQIYVELGATQAAGLVNASRVVACVAVAVAFLSLRKHIRLRGRDCFELVAILVGGLVLQPLVFFICYFCLLHSPRHLMAASRDVGLVGVRAIIIAAAPPVGATLALAAVLWHFLPGSLLSSRVLEIVFIGLAALTVPHMLLTTIKERDQRLKCLPAT